MSDITLVGLGWMGTALGQALLNGGRSLTVWNRSPQRASTLVSLGASHLADLSEAIASSAVIVICVADYAVTNSLLARPEVAICLSEKTVVQLSTGTPAEARDAETFFRGNGAAYLDGAIMAFPERIGMSDTMILFSGKSDAWNACNTLLKPLGGDLRYVGENAGAAAALDMALLTRTLAMVLGIAHGARVCAVEGVDMKHYVEAVSHGNEPRLFAEPMATDDFANPGATMNVWRHALKQIRDHARATGIGSDVPDFIDEIFSRAIARGHGEHHVAALREGLRPVSAPTDDAD